MFYFQCNNHSKQKNTLNHISLQYVSEETHLILFQALEHISDDWLNLNTSVIYQFCRNSLLFQKLCAILND